MDSPRYETQREELKPCPFCGGMNLQVKVGTILGHMPVSAVYCMTCGGAGTHSEIQAHAIEFWNRRYPAPSLPAEDWVHGQDFREALCAELRLSVTGSAVDRVIKIVADFSTLRPPQGGHE